MRILYILTSLGLGGAEKQTIDLASLMVTRGHTVSLLVLLHAGEEWPVKVPVLRLNMSKDRSGFVHGLQFARKFLALFRPDILHSHTYPANMFARILQLTLIVKPVEELRPMLVNTVHNVFEGGWKRMMAYRLTSPLADLLTAVSQAAADRHTSTGATPRRKMRVLTNAIDPAQFTPDATRRKRMRKELQAGHGFIWLAVGRIAPAKDYPNLLRAFATMRKAMSSNIVATQLWIAGEGNMADIPGAPADALSETHGVRVLGLRRDVAALLDAADGFVLSSAWEGMPLVVGEAMAMQLPIVATRVGGVEELVGDAGLLVPAGDSDAFSIAMISALEMSDAGRKNLGLAARERIQSHFSMDARTGEWERLYAALLTGGK